MAMKHCPQCGSKLPNEQVKFCPDCGYKLLSQAESDYNIVCPDCKTAISNVNEDCPVCGCPSSLFIKQTKTSSLCGEIMECPDCGKVFDETIPSECPNCGCPSGNFKIHEEKKVNTSSIQHGNFQKLRLITVSIIAVLGVLVYFAYKEAKEADQARQEQYEKEQFALERAKQDKIRRENEERKREETLRQQKRNDMINKLLGTWKTGTFSTRTGIYEFRMTFESSGQIEINMYDYVGSSFGRLKDVEYGSWEMQGPTESDNSIYLIIRWNGNSEKNRFTGTSVSFLGRTYSKGRFGF